MQPETIECHGIIAFLLVVRVHFLKVFIEALRKGFEANGRLFKLHNPFVAAFFPLDEINRSHGVIAHDGIHFEASPCDGLVGVGYDYIFAEGVHVEARAPADLDFEGSCL